MSLTLAYCENFRRSLWSLKNNQTRKERFFRWFLTFVVIKSNLDAFALTCKGLAKRDRATNFTDSDAYGWLRLCSCN